MPSGDALFIVGCGNSGNDLKNALSIKTNGDLYTDYTVRAGSIVLHGSGTVTVDRAPSANMEVATKKYTDDKLVSLSQTIAEISTSNADYSNYSAPTTESSFWTVTIFDTIYNLTSTTVASRMNIGDSPYVGTAITRGTTTIGSTSYPSIDFNIGGPTYVIYKANNKIYAASYASGYPLIISKEGTSNDI